MPDIAPLRPGDPRRLGGLELLGRLGEGGQGEVFLAREPSGTQVAVKWLRPESAGDEVSVGRFLREVQVAQQVAPFCTAAVLGTGVEHDRPYIVSEFIEGPSLQRIVQQEGPRAGSTLHRLAIGTATALAAIHQAGIVHRDFKPANVILGADGPRVIDFGIARALDATSTISSMPVGTPAYMPPEQILGHQVGPAADMFSWAGTMVYAASGRAPFGSDTMPAVINRVLNQPPDVIELDGSLREVVMACLSKDPAQRPSAEQVIMRLLQRPMAPGSGILAQGSAAAVPAAAPSSAPAAVPAPPWASPAQYQPPTAPSGYPQQPYVPARPPKRSPRTSLIMGVTVGCALLLLAGVVTIIRLDKTPAVATQSHSPSPTRSSSTPTARPTPTTTEVPPKGTARALPGASATLYEHPSDAITLTSYEVYNESGKEWTDYARKSLRGKFTKYPRNKESMVSPDGRFLAARGKEFDSDDYDFIDIIDQRTGEKNTVTTVKAPLESTIRSWSQDGTKLLLNIEEEKDDEWYYIGFAVIDVKYRVPKISLVRDKQVQETGFGWDAEEQGAVNVYGGKNKGLRFYDAAGEKVRDAPGIGAPASGTSAMFSPSGAAFVTNCPNGGDGDHCVWDSRTGKRLRTFTSDCDKVLGWYDETHLYCWEQDNETKDTVQVVDFRGKLVRKLLDITDDVDFSPIYTFNPR
ncbi:WD40 repeat domain-containing serine/threonine protein kinase [Nonomuraea sp. SBT364]|uniref:WD40 repeat domain-containing serine/threonine protein kinase n=1 Tax=Nonomuraea sp. SBT364 TaxID=1580530 RepID=UPI00069F0754|nr:WD40 repeat domain-containing serine/threonine protein kinase [Nonomuraea sp. SBT364]